MRKFFLNITNLPKWNLRLISVFLLAFIGIIDSLTGVEFTVHIFYLAPIIFCAWYSDRISGIVISLLAAVIWFSAEFFSSKGFSHPVIPVINTLLMLGIFIIVSELLSGLKRVVSRENELAVRVQTGLLPKEIPYFDSLQISVTWKPLGHVSGDYYDIIDLGSNRLAICIADVCGHGVPAALLMSNIQAGFYATIQNDPAPANVSAKLNQIIKRHQLSDKFISFFYCIIDLEEKSLTYTNAGHPPPLIINKEGSADKLSEGGTMLGVLHDFCYSQEKIYLTGGEVVVLYTDGITEAENKAGEMFGEENFIHKCKENRHLDSHEFKNALLNCVNSFNSNIHNDDYTLLVMKYEE